jgi:hypothetical protein
VLEIFLGERGKRHGVKRGLSRKDAEALSRGELKESVLKDFAG